MFLLLKTNGKKWSNSEVSVLQGNRRRFTPYLTRRLKHTPLFPHGFHSPKHSEEHTADNNTRSIIHSVPDFISSPLFLSTTLCTYPPHPPTPPTVPHAHTKCTPVLPPFKRAGEWAANAKPWKPAPGQTPPRLLRREPLPERRSCDVRPQQTRSWRDGKRPYFIRLEGDRPPRGAEW